MRPPGNPLLDAAYAEQSALRRPRSKPQRRAPAQNSNDGDNRVAEKKLHATMRRELPFHSKSWKGAESLLVIDPWRKCAGPRCTVAVPARARTVRARPISQAHAEVSLRANVE